MEVVYGGESVSADENPLWALKLAMIAGENVSSHRKKCDWSEQAEKIVAEHFAEHLIEWKRLHNRMDGNWRCSFSFDLDFIVQKYNFFSHIVSEGWENVSVDTTEAGRIHIYLGGNRIYIGNAPRNKEGGNFLIRMLLEGSDRA